MNGTSGLVSSFPRKDSPPNEGAALTRRRCACVVRCGVVENPNSRLNVSQFVTPTTIRLSRGMRKRLEAMKLHPRETYEEVLERLLEDLRELNDQTKEEIERAVREIKAGKHRNHDQLKAEMGFR